MNESNTLGQRIQAGRKAAGLSQEALGERLGVSRQAVSKWESDIAIPELENLIAMSRMFGVPVGVLLGVEKDEETAPTLSEQELQVAQAIAEKYGKRRKWVLPLAIVSGIAVIGMFCGLLFQVLRLQDEIESLRAGITGPSTVVIPQQSTGTSTGILIESDAKVTEFGLVENTVTLEAYGIAREWSVETRGIFTARFDDGQEYTLEAACVNGRFSAEDWTLPWEPEEGLNLRLSLSLLDGDTARSDAIFLPSYRPDDFRLSIYGSVSSNVTTFGHLTADADTFAVSSVRLQYYPDFEGYPIELYPTAIDLCVFRNEEAAPESVTPLQPGWLTTDTQAQYSIMRNLGSEQNYLGLNMDINIPVKIASEDAVVPVIRVTDNFGRYTYYGDSFYTADTDKAVSERGLANDWIPGESPWDHLGSLG